jgi:hypothetical protein
MSRLFLAAGVAAFAIAGAANAKPGGGHGGGGGGGNLHGGGGNSPAVQQQGGGGGGHGGGHGGGSGAFAMPQMRGGGGGGHGHGEGGGFAMPQMMMRGGGHGHGGGSAAPQFQAQRGGSHGGGGHAEQRFAMPRQQSVQHGRGGERVQEQRQLLRGNQIREAQNRGAERRQMRTLQVQSRGFESRQLRTQQAQNRALERQKARGFERGQLEQRFARQQLEAYRIQQAQTGFVGRDFNQRFRINQDYANRYYGAAGQRGLIDGCPPGLAAKNNGCLPPGQAMKLLGAPLAAVAGYTALKTIPSGWSYLYPDTQGYYYRYGGGYLYQVNRGTNLIDSLYPLMAGGYLPGQYLPQPYMASYVPASYGFNSFYPDYGGLCNRYANGVVYQVDCHSGMVEDVIPLYASGYGVGQVLPASYDYYNVPYQYRSMYYNTPNYNYWYAPGAIYQYDPGTSMITSVAALLSPGYSVGQALPAGYDVYNVPYAYRDTYYDTPNAWYRYNNGYIYQVDPVTRLVTAIVASLLT